MKYEIDEALHERHSEAFLRQIAENTFMALDQFGIRGGVRKEMAIEILHGICAVLDGAAHGGTLESAPAHPFLGFYLEAPDGSDTVLIPRGGSHIHEFINSLVDDYA